ncbi:HK97-gp10 family putative phage morphogenesis protein [Desemzia incerta]|uniref:HK97-gp10 family putative phage morphogenesis protein n=1 Tax=Desemzia incerta TaxID=82801 RepID=UPI003CFF5BEC
MATNKNGFADALNQINTLLNVNQSVQLDALEEAADYFAKQLKGNIKDGPGNQHISDKIEIVVEKGQVSVKFGKDGWYWFLANNGHKKSNGKGRVKGQHFVENTMTKEESKIAEIMTSKIIKKMEG